MALRKMDFPMSELGVSRSTVLRLIATRGLPTVRVGRQLRFDEEQVRGWTKRQTEIHTTAHVLPIRRVSRLGRG